MSEQLTLKEYMKEDAFIFDNISTSICKEENINYESLVQKCDKFENNIVLFKILPSFYVIRSILSFKLGDWETAFKYINASLKYLVYVAKSSSTLSQEEKINFDKYKTSVLDQYKILLQKEPNYQNSKNITLPKSIKFITTSDEVLIDEEINKRVLERKK